MLYSSDLGEEPQPEAPAAPAATEKARPSAAVPVRTPIQGESTPRHDLPTDTDHPIDRRAFLAAFKRQTTPQLLTCLATWETPPAWVALTGVLDQAGFLRHVTALDPTRPLPPCAASAIEAMTFTAAGRSLRRTSITLQWRLDW